MMEPSHRSLLARVVSCRVGSICCKNAGRPARHCEVCMQPFQLLVYWPSNLLVHLRWTVVDETACVPLLLPGSGATRTGIAVKRPCIAGHLPGSVQPTSHQLRPTAATNENQVLGPPQSQSGQPDNLGEVHITSKPAPAVGAWPEPPRCCCCMGPPRWRLAEC